MQVLASLIYTASTLHAAVNFPQRPILTFAPNTPGAIYSAPPTDKVRSRVVLDSGPNVFDVQKYRISIHNFGRNLCPILWQPSFVSLICIIYIYIYAWYAVLNKRLDASIIGLVQAASFVCLSNTTVLQ